MQGKDIAGLRTELQNVRGETRVKTKEEPIRNSFLQSAATEIFADHDWVFNRRSVAIDTLELGANGVKLPNDFSMFNDYYIGTKNGSVIQIRKEYLTIQQEGPDTYLLLPVPAQYELVYYIQAPDIVDTQELIYFPQPILIAERAYVRLKTAYFPDEKSDKELAASKRACRELFVKSAPKRDFTSARWG